MEYGSPGTVPIAAPPALIERTVWVASVCVDVSCSGPTCQVRTLASLRPGSSSTARGAQASGSGIGSTHATPAGTRSPSIGLTCSVEPPSQP